MKILILNGSPKGKYSITLQTLKYLELKFPEHTFEVIHVGQQINKLMKDMSSVIESINDADLIIFSYPVYTFIAPYQMHKFIELLKQQDIDLSNKFATQISTSKHFYDMTAHQYIEDNIYDLKMKYIKGLSADMDDLTSQKGQREAIDFFNYVIWSIENNIYEVCQKTYTSPIHNPATIPTPISKRDGDVVIITDCDKEDTHLQNMIARFQAVLPIKSRIVNILDYPFMGGCLGCFNCAVNGKCIYKDNFDEYLRNDIQKADAIVYAFSIKDHSMGSRFKLYDDRQFCNGHRTVTIGMPVGYIVSGNLNEENNLKTIIEARAQVGSNNLCSIATDEDNTDASIDKLVKTLDYALLNKYVPPQNFYGIGGMKVFRDLIWLMQGMMRADHKFYKAHKQYDFPQKKWPQMLAMYLVGELIAHDNIKAKIGNKMNEGMIMPYKKVLENAKKEK